MSTQFIFSNTELQDALTSKLNVANPTSVGISTFPNVVSDSTDTNQLSVRSGQIQLGSLPTRTVLNGTATTLKQINFPDISGLSVVSNQTTSFLNTSNISNSFLVPGTNGTKLFRISCYANTRIPDSGFLDRVSFQFTDETGIKIFQSVDSFLQLTTNNFSSFTGIIRANSGSTILISSSTLNSTVGRFNIFITLEQIT